MSSAGPKKFDVVVIGGGPSGSSAAIGLARGGMAVAVVEKKLFPREVLCGEFLSHEVVGAIRRFGLADDFFSLHPNRITQFSFVADNRVESVHPLGFEAWSLKRSLLDQMLLRSAESSGATLVQPAEVISVRRREKSFDVECRKGREHLLFSAQHVVAAYGRYDHLDRVFKRDFVPYRSGMHGVKYHVDRAAFNEFPEDEIRLYATEGVYCGITRVNDSEATLCFLSEDRGGEHPDEALQTLFEQNGRFRQMFRVNLPAEAKKLSRSGAGNIYFGKREVVENGVFMVGDAAGVIAPLAGDGIAMAMEGGQLIAELLTEAREALHERSETEELYRIRWRRMFRQRLFAASLLQHGVLNAVGGNIGGRMMRAFPYVAGGIVRWTRSRLIPL